MNFHLLLALHITLGFALAAPVQAQTVYRCGDNSYSQTPCAGGVAMENKDSRDSTQKAQADAATERQKKSARVLEQERLKQEAAAKTSQKTASPGTRPEADKKPALAKQQKPEYFTAREPRPTKEKPKADGAGPVKP